MDGGGASTPPGRDPSARHLSEFLPQTTALEVQSTEPSLALDRPPPPVDGHRPKTQYKNHLPHQAGRPVPRHHAAGLQQVKCVYTASTYLKSGEWTAYRVGPMDGKGGVVLFLSVPSALIVWVWCKTSASPTGRSGGAAGMNQVLGIGSAMSVPSSCGGR